MISTRITRAAPAKLNLFLHITGQRADGYHDLQTVFQFLDRADLLHFTSRDDGQVVLADPLPGVAQDDDLVCKAADLLRSCVNAENTGTKFAGESPGATIHREKVLPIGGGLGGGSSNAATTLVALNELWNLQLSQQRLLHLALKIGADVPVFVHGRACWAEGVGENFTEIQLPEPVYLILTPPVSVSTAKVFCSEELTRNCSPITIRDFLDGTGRNVFEPVVRALYPVIGETLDWLEKNADFPAAMSGTGSCVFVRCKNQKEALNLLGSLRQDGPKNVSGFVARGKNRSPLYENSPGAE